MIKIDKGVPCPPATTGAPARLYPWAEMEVGDSFYVEATPERSAQQISGALGRTMNYQTRKTGKRFTQRRTPGGVRVWRTQ